MWTQQEAIQLARKVEEVCPACGCHVALTGGALYKDGPRKDCDLLFYRIRQEPYIREHELAMALRKIGIVLGDTCGWVTKATYEGKSVDLFFPDRDDSEGYWR